MERERKLARGGAPPGLPRAPPTTPMPLPRQPLYLALAMSSAPRSRRHHLLPLLAALAAFALVLLPSAVALAAGNFTIKTTSVAESSAEWHIKVRIDLS